VREITVHIIERNVLDNKTIDHGKFNLQNHETLTINDNAPHPVFMFEVKDDVLHLMFVSNEPVFDRPVRPLVRPPSISIVPLTKQQEALSD
jgi:hypothetical protein